MMQPFGRLAAMVTVYWRGVPEPASTLTDWIGAGTARRPVANVGDGGGVALGRGGGVPVGGAVAGTVAVLLSATVGTGVGVAMTSSSPRMTK
jgi:hypothetical protein